VQGTQHKKPGKMEKDATKKSCGVGKKRVYFMFRKTRNGRENGGTGGGSTKIMGGPGNKCLVVCKRSTQKGPTVQKKMGGGGGGPIVFWEMIRDKSGGLVANS